MTSSGCREIRCLRHQPGKGFCQAFLPLKFESAHRFHHFATVGEGDRQENPAPPGTAASSLRARGAMGTFFSQALQKHCPASTGFLQKRHLSGNSRASSLSPSANFLSRLIWLYKSGGKPLLPLPYP